MRTAERRGRQREREREIVSWTDLWKGLQKEAGLWPFWNFRCFGKSTTYHFQRLRVLVAGTLCAQSWALGRDLRAFVSKGGAGGRGHILEPGRGGLDSRGNIHIIPLLHPNWLQEQGRSQSLGLSLLTSKMGINLPLQRLSGGVLWSQTH